MKYVLGQLADLNHGAQDRAPGCNDEINEVFAHLELLSQSRPGKPLPRSGCELEDQPLGVNGDVSCPLLHIIRELLTAFAAARYRVAGAYTLNPDHLEVAALIILTAPSAFIPGHLVAIGGALPRGIPVPDEIRAGNRDTVADAVHFQVFTPQCPE
jgi:hypothetical protein